MTKVSFEDFYQVPDLKFDILKLKDDLDSILKSKNFIDGIEVRPQEIINTINSFKKEKDTSKNLLDLAWKYKSNINFLRLTKDFSERSDLEEICKLIKDLIKEKKELIKNFDKSVDLDSYKLEANKLEDLLYNELDFGIS